MFMYRVSHKKNVLGNHSRNYGSNFIFHFHDVFHISDLLEKKLGL